MNIAPNITLARKRKRLKRAELARLLGVSRSTVTTWESGGPGPRMSALPDIAEALGVTVSWLLRAR